jgi:hypothetical protein
MVTIRNVLYGESDVWSHETAMFEYQVFGIRKNWILQRFSRLKFNVQLRLSGISLIERLKSSDVSADIVVAIFRVNVY